MYEDAHFQLLLKQCIPLRYNITPGDMPIIISSQGMRGLGLAVFFPSKEVYCDEVLIPTRYAISVEERKLDTTTLEDILQKINEIDIQNSK